MYLRTLLYALLQGVALGTHEPPSNSPSQGCASTTAHGEAIGACSGALVKYDGSAESVRVPDELLDLYLSSQDSTSLTSKVLDVYAAYVDEGEVSVAAVRLRVVAAVHAVENDLRRPRNFAIDDSRCSTALMHHIHVRIVCPHPMHDSAETYEYLVIYDNCISIPLLRLSNNGRWVRTLWAPSCPSCTPPGAG